MKNTPVRHFIFYHFAGLYFLWVLHQFYSHQKSWLAILEPLIFFQVDVVEATTRTDSAADMQGVNMVSNPFIDNFEQSLKRLLNPSHPSRSISFTIAF